MRLRGYQHQRLDGSTPAHQRHQAMDHFNAPGGFGAGLGLAGWGALHLVYWAAARRAGQPPARMPRLVGWLVGRPPGCGSRCLLAPAGAPR